MKTKCQRGPVRFAYLGKCLLWMSFMIMGSPTVLQAATQANIPNLKAGQNPPLVPDFTAGDTYATYGTHHDWTLGPTGARGWMWGWQLSTDLARQIYVTEVAAGSPAAQGGGGGVLKVGDVILGINGANFTSDARIALGKAITEAEKSANNGALKLTRWRNGTTSTVTITLPVKGDYSELSPVSCSKSTAIMQSAGQYIVNKGLTKDIPGYVNALGLLATGDAQYDTLLRNYARSLVPNTGPGAWNWDPAYMNLFLCEYYLAKNDAQVLPEIRQLCLFLANSQGQVGSWGHTPVCPNQILGGYGALNSVGLVCAISLELGRKCAINEPAVDLAVSRAADFFRRFVGCGTIPYGDHSPPQVHDDNGKNSMAAVFYDLIGEADACAYYSRMTVASYGLREVGHTGNYWSYLWGALGAQRSGDEASAAFLREQYWFHDLERRWDGGFIYQGGAGQTGSEHTTPGWDVTGARMLMYALPLKKLYITGKVASSAPVLSSAEVSETIASGKDLNVWYISNIASGNNLVTRESYDALTNTQLLALLDTWSCEQRDRAARALSRKSSPPISNYRTMLASANRDTILGGLYGLMYTGSKAGPALADVQPLLNHSDIWVQFWAGKVMCAIGGTARATTLPVVFGIASAAPDANDPRGFRQRFAAYNLWGNGWLEMSSWGLMRNYKSADLETLVPAVRRTMQHEHSVPRMYLAEWLDTLTFDELAPYWFDIYRAVETQAPTAVMWNHEPRDRCMNILQRNNFKETVDAAATYAETMKNHGAENRMRQVMDVLVSFGTESKRVLPRLYAARTFYQENFGPGKPYDFPQWATDQMMTALNDGITAIENSTTAPANLKTIQDYSMFVVTPPNASPAAVFVNQSTTLSVKVLQGENLPMTYTWSKVSGPGTVNFGSANASQTTATFSKAGTYQLQVVVKDAYRTKTLTMPMVVSAQPTVNAGTDQIVTLSGGSAPAVTAGANIELNANSHNGTSTWSDSKAVWNLTLGTGVTHVSNPVSSLPGITAAYDFPGGTGGTGGATGASFDSSTMTGNWDTNPVSIEIWFKPDSAADDGRANGQILFETGGGTGLGIFYNDGKIQVGHGTTQVIANCDVSGLISEYIQVVMTYDETNFVLYVNGASAATGTRSASDWAGSDGSGLGCRGGSNTGGRGNGDANTESFEGAIAIFRAYKNKVLTAAEVLANYQSVAGVSVASAALNGTVTDPDSAPTTTWSAVSGPGSVAFDNASAVDTTARFRVAGNYTLRLTANDGVAAPVSDDMVITVKDPVSPTTYTVTYTAGANGTITGQSSQTVNAGGSTTAVTAAPNSGYRFKNWSDGSTANPRTDTNVTANLSVTANFELIPAPTTYTVTYTAGANGTITGQKSQTVSAGGSTTSVTAAPNSGYLFKNWSDGSTANPRTDTNVNSNISVTANFELKPPLTAYAGQDQTIFLNGGTGVPWMPNPSELQAWFDVSDAGTIVLENGSSTAVKQWSDKSGNGRHLTQTNTSAQPTLGVNEIQMPVNKYMLSADGMMPTGSGGRHVFAVVNNTTTTNVGFISQAHGNWNARTGFAITGEPAVRYSGAMTFGGGALSANDNLIAVSYDSGTNVSTMRYAVNGTQRVGTIVSGDGALASNATKLYVGCNHLGSLSTSQGAANFRELIILTDATLSINTQQKIEGYLAHKWGLTANLPEGHPYKKAAPTTDGASATATLNGTVGAPTATWSVVSTQPAGLSVNFANAASPVTTASFTAVGTYTLRLTASDGIAAPVSDDVVITVEESGVTTYTVSYTAGANGTITGQSSQTVSAGGSTSSVTAQPNSGYVFTNWSDGSTANPRSDTNVNSNISVTAVFELQQPLTSYAGEDQTVALVDTSIPWTPADMETIIWLDASDGSTISADGSNLVSEWRDKRGTGLNLTQAMASRQPTTGATINSLNAIDFTGDVMTTATNPFGTTVSDAFVITVHKVDAVANGILFSMTGATSPTGSRWQANAPWGDGSMNFDVNASAPGPNRLSAPYGASAGSTVISSFYNSTTDNVQQVYKNGALLAGDSTGASANTVSGLSIGGVGTTCQNTTIGEMIVINGTVSVDDRQKLEGYLAHKWGLADNLPEGHPHKGAAPTTGGGTTAIVTLSGSVGDPYGSTPTATWSVVSTQPAGLSVEFADPSSPSTSASFAAAGIYTLRLTATSGAAAPVSDQVVITVESEPSAQYAAWIGDQGVLAEAALMDDTDGDGKANLMEFAFGTNPSAMDVGPLAVDGSRRGDPKLMKEEGGGFALYYIRRADHGKSGSVIYTTYFSNDLTNFTPSSAGLEVVDSAGVGYELVKVPFPNGARFGYVKVEVSP